MNFIMSFNEDELSHLTNSVASEKLKWLKKMADVTGNPSNYDNVTYEIELAMEMVYALDKLSFKLNNAKTSAK